MRRKSPYCGHGFYVCCYDCLAKGLHETANLPFQFCQVHKPVQYKTVWMLYGLGNTSTINRTGPCGASNGPITPNRLPGP